MGDLATPDFERVLEDVCAFRSQKMRWFPQHTFLVLPQEV
jgi:hypothetical protein